MPLITLDNVTTAFGHLPLLDKANLQIDPGERVAVIGRNGSGKSTILRILSGELTPDTGSVWRAPGTSVSRLVQDAAQPGTGPVFDAVADGLGELRDLVREYHRAAVAVTEDPSEARLETLGRLQHDLEERDGWRVEQRVELVLSRLGLPADRDVSALSGGWRRRVLLARALVSAPALLLLDEPTNHLDIESIEWLEAFLLDYAGAVVFVTHDRVFLQRVATRIVELDRGRLTSWPGDYATFLEKKEAWLANEALAQAKFDKKLGQEEVWLRRGVKARRTRDEGRVKALMAMREERRARRAPVGQVKLAIGAAERPGQVVFDVQDVSKSYDGVPVVRDLTLRVMRGDRIGLIGPNGAGKTTVLRMLVGDLAPDTGTIHQGSNVQVAYFDQQREQLDPERTVVDTVADGNDTVTIAGVTRHVHGYLEDFLFPPERARSQVKTLSGGERNRLLLARLLTRPANVLVLDEPTNDLDIETLELLEAQLVAYPGTLLVVSHDRAFLDNIVTSTLVFEGDGRVVEYVGGYDDWLQQRPAAAEQIPRTAGATRETSGAARSPAAIEDRAPATERTGGSGAGASSQAVPSAPKKLSFNERRELEVLPERIEALEAEERRVQATIGDPEFYRKGAAEIRDTLARVDPLRQELELAYARWDELDSRKHLR